MQFTIRRMHCRWFVSDRIFFFFCDCDTCSSPLPRPPLFLSKKKLIKYPSFFSYLPPLTLPFPHEPCACIMCNSNIYYVLATIYFVREERPEADGLLRRVAAMTLWTYLLQFPSSLLGSNLSTFAYFYFF